VLRYSVTTLGLVIIVMLCSAVIGAGAAWLVTTTDFPGRRWLEIALALPLAFPAYVLAYGYTHVLDHPGIVQSTLRDVMDWGPRDYWFPEIRSLGGAAMMLTLVTDAANPAFSHGADVGFRFLFRACVAWGHRAGDHLGYNGAWF